MRRGLFILFLSLLATVIVGAPAFAASPQACFSKDRDPGVGPKALFANRIGLQVYIHPDGSGGLSPGDGTLLDALLHPKEHFLMSFNDVSLSAALRPLLATQAACG